MSNHVASGGIDSMIQSQILTMMSLKPNGNIMEGLYAIVIIMIINKMCSILPFIWQQIENFSKLYLKQKQKEYTDKLITNINLKKEKKGSILFEKTKNNDNPETITALIRHISNLKTSERILFNNDYYVVNQEEFMIDPDIFCNVHNWEKDDKDLLAKYTFEIYSYVYNVEDLKEFINKIVENYRQDKANNLGKQPHYFNEIKINLPKNIDGSYRFDAAPKSLIFDMTPFYTNKSLSNVFGKHLDVLKQRIDMFINNPRWYKKKGIPYTLGILLSGPPGTGKTSTIKAIANDTNRHIFNISLNEMITQTQLKTLFFSTEVKIVKDGRNEIIHIPLDKRIYVIEDIDALGDIVLDRKLKKQKKYIDKNIDKIYIASNKSINDKIILDEEDMEVNMYNPNIMSSNESIDEKLNRVNMQRQQDAEKFYNNIDKGQNENQNINGFNGYSDYANLNDIGNLPVNIKSFNDNISSHEIKIKKQIDNQEIDNPEKLNLSFILNLLDGVLETPGRILIMTSNHPELLDPALIRPGRIDVNLTVGNCTRNMIIDMFKFFYDDDEINLDDWKYNTELTPAEVSGILQNNFNSYQNAKQELINKTNN